MKKIKVISIICLVISSIMLIVGCGKDKSAKMSNEKIRSIQTDTEKENSMQIELYFDASSSEGNKQLYKEDRILNKEEVMGEVIIQELIKGPGVRSDLKPVLPKETRLLGFSIKNKIAIINFSKEVITKMEPAKEETSLKAIAGSLTQLPSVERVKIQVENKNVDTLGGNYDISEPFSKSEVTLKLKEK